MKADKLNPDRIKNVVVRAPNWLGDAVMSVPALQALRRLLPNARITLVARPGASDIFIDADFVDEVVIYERAGILSVWKQIQRWRRAQFDLAVLLQNAFEAALIAALARVPIRVGYRTERRGFLLTNPLPLPDWKDERHESFYYLNIIGELERYLYGAVPAETIMPRFDLGVSPDRRQRARSLLHEHGARTGAPIVLLCPGSINSRAKRWPAERYAALGDRLIESGANVVLIGSPGELDVSQEVCRHAQHQPIVLTGATSVAEATALINIADVLITNDTGPAHIGAALQTPTLVIFGPTNPLTTYPMSPNAEIIRHPPDCAPCMLRDCPIDHRCMTAITPEEVFERASALMARHHAEVGA
ncbi:MAG: lipopolysaccharide heptosyltransferase II [Acidobacteriota bacterium]